jgi:hypothetical protein
MPDPLGGGRMENGVRAWHSESRKNDYW